MVLFWLLFAIIIFGLFIFNRDTIRTSVEAVRAANQAPEELPQEEPPALPAPVSSTPVSPAPASPAPASPAPALPAPVSPAPAASPPPAPPAQVSSAAAPVELRERSLYFIQVDRNGIILRIQVQRSIPLSESPMGEVMEALIAGPTPEERGRGLITLIPPGTQLLSATIRGRTAVLSFNEDFQYNTYGVEGYMGQLRQIVFTATEFPNIDNVQILIEGRQVDYLGEGIWIGNPLGREGL